MKKILFLGMFIFMLWNCSAFAQNPTFNFLDHKFTFYSLQKNYYEYDMVNRYSTEGFELKDKTDYICLFHSNTGFPIKEVFQATAKEYGRVYNVGSQKETANKYTISYTAFSNDTYLYSILQFTNNEIAGVDSAQIYMNVPHNADIKELDKKYFAAFSEMKFPQIFDEDGNKLPPIYNINFNDKKFFLKQSDTDGKNFYNTYFTKKENLGKYKQRINVNYRTDRINSDKIVKDIIKSNQYADGFKVITNEKENKIHFFSYIIDINDFSTKKTYVSYNILKLMPYKRGIKGIQYVKFLSKDKNRETTITQIEKTYREYIKNYEIPAPVDQKLGRPLHWTENPYHTLTRGLHK